MAGSQTTQTANNMYPVWRIVEWSCHIAKVRVLCRVAKRLCSSSREVWGVTSCCMCRLVRCAVMSTLLILCISASLYRCMYLSCLFSRAFRKSVRAIFRPQISTDLTSMFPSSVMMNLYRWKVAQGSPMFNSPDKMSCLLSSFIALTVGKHGTEISPSGSLLLRLRIRGVVLVLCSKLRVSIPCFLAVSFKTCPAFLLGILATCHFRPINFLMWWKVL